jgi:hypothetical protein
MASKLNSEFNYRYQVMGHTIWEKIKTLKGFLEGRIRAAALEEVSALQLEAKIAEVEHLREHGLRHEYLKAKGELIELESHQPSLDHGFELNREEIAMLERLLAEAYEIAEPTRIPGYTDEQMFEINGANEFTAMIAREIQAEIIAHGRPSPAKLANAMSNPFTFNALKKAGLIPADTVLIGPNNNPLRIELAPIEANEQEETLVLAHTVFNDQPLTLSKEEELLLEKLKQETVTAG